MKRVRSVCMVLLCAMIISSLSIGASAATRSGDICDYPEAPYRSYGADALLVPSIEPVSAKIATIQVKVNSPCDQKWRNTYPKTWMAEANTAVEAADGQLYEWFGIDFLSVAQDAWTAPTSTSYTTLLDDAIDDFGVTSGSQIMIAFSGVTNTGAGGAAYMNSRHSIIFDQGRDNNGKVIRHEVGHLYGCPDEYNTATGEFTSRVCLMNNCYDYYEDLCGTCTTIWERNKDSK